MSLSNPVSSKEYFEDHTEETTYSKSESIEDKFEELEKKLETKNMDVENLQKRLAEMEVQFESRVEETTFGTRSPEQ